MVFESVVSYFLEKYLSEYVDNFDASKLKIGIWSGDVVLENLYVKPNALDSLGLPIRVGFGHLKKLTLVIPWKSIYSDSVRVVIDGLTIVMAPKSSITYDAELEKRAEFEKKINQVKKLTAIEASKQAEANKGQGEADKQAKKSDSFADRLEMTILKNLELTIKNIHIRYEDDFSNVEYPFSIGFTLNQIQVKTNATDDDTNYIYKAINISALGIYSNSHDEMLHKSPREQGILKLQNMLQTVGQDGRFEHILKPLNLTAKAILNMKPAQDSFSAPMLDIKIVLESILLELNRLQYLNLIDVVNSLDHMRANAKYQKYRPSLNQKLSARERWRFAMTAILDSVVRPRREKFKWSRMKKIIDTRREYTKLLKKKIQNVKLNERENAQEKEFIEILDVFNLMLARKQAEVEIARDAASKSSQSSWWKWTWGGSQPVDPEKAKIMDAAELSAEEKKKLYDAIGYKDDEYSEYPQEYENLKLHFQLGKFEVALNDGHKDSFKNILRLSVTKMDLDMAHRSFDSGIKFSSGVQSVRVNGVARNSVLPVLVEPDVDANSVATFKYEANPLDKALSKRLVLNLESLRIKYDAETVKSVMNFFKSKKILRSKKMKSAALKSIAEFKERSLLYMKNKIQSIEKTDFQIDIKPSYLLLPQGGHFTKNTKSLCFIFGHFSLKSDLGLEITKQASEDDYMSASDEEKDTEFEDALEEVASEAEKSKQALMHNVIEASYIKYKLNLEQVQVLFTENGEQSTLARIKETQDKDSYVLTPVDLYLNFHQCIYVDDVNLPVLKLFGSLPIIHIDMTDQKILLLKRVLSSLGLSDVDEPAPPLAELSSYGSSQYEDLSASMSDSGDLEMLENLDLNQVARELASSAKPADTTDQLMQAINFQMSFEILEIRLTIRETVARYFDSLQFSIKSVGCLVELKSYDQTYNIYLSSIACDYGLFNDIDGKRLRLVSSMRGNASRDTKYRLIDINVTQTSRDSPTLFLLHNKALMNVQVEMSQVQFKVHLVALRNILQFLNKFAKELGQSTSPESSPKTALSPSSSSEQLSQVASSELKKSEIHLTEAQLQYLIQTGRNNEKAVPRSKSRFGAFDPDLIDLNVDLKMAGVSVILCTDKQAYYQASLSKLTLKSQFKAGEKSFDVVLRSIDLVDLANQSIYTNLIYLKESTQDLIQSKVKLVERPESDSEIATELNKRLLFEKYYFRNYFDMNHVDLVLQTEINKLQFILVFKHLEVIKRLVKILDVSEVSEPAAKVLEETRSKIIDSSGETKRGFQYDFVSRMKLNVTVNAPILIVPESSTSRKGLLLDLGDLTLVSNYELQSDYYQKKRRSDGGGEQSIVRRFELPPVLELLTVSFKNMQMLKIDLDEHFKWDREILLLELNDFIVFLKRNPQPSLFKDIEAVSVQTIFYGLIATVSQPDYMFALDVLKSLNEKPDDHDVDAASAEKDEKMSVSPVKLASAAESNKLALYEDADFDLLPETPNIEVKLTLSSIKVFLFSDASALKKISDKRLVYPRRKAFCRFLMKSLELEIKNFADETGLEKLQMAVSLSDLILDDTRLLKTENRLFRLINKNTKNEEKQIIKFSLEQKKKTDLATSRLLVTEREVSLDVVHLRICVNVDFLMQLGLFFVPNLTQMNQEAIDKIKEVPEQVAALQAETKPVDSAIESTKLRVNLESPQIILYDNQYDLKKSNCLTIQGVFMLQVGLNNDNIKVLSSINQLMIQMRVVSRSPKETAHNYVIMVPTSLLLTGQINTKFTPKNPDLDETNDVFEKSFTVEINNLKLKVCPLVMVKLVDLLNSLKASVDKYFAPGAIEAEVKEEKKTPVTSLYQPLSFENNDFWFTCKKEEPALGLEKLISPVNSAYNKIKLHARVTRASVNLESGISEPIPLVGLSFGMNALYRDFNVHMDMTSTTTVEMAYFNESLNVYEPIIEPVENRKTEELNAYEITVQMIKYDQSEPKLEGSQSALAIPTKELETTQAERGKFKMETKILTTFQLLSADSLQFVVSKAFLNMTNKIVKSLEPVKETSSDEVADYEVSVAGRGRAESIKKPAEAVEERDSDTEDEAGANHMEQIEGLYDEKYEEVFVFNILVKNELGTSVQLKTLNQFKFIDLANASGKDSSQVALKDGEFIPLTIASNELISLKAKDDHSPHFHPIRFEISMPNQKWEPVNVHANLNGYSINQINSKASKDEVSIICETISQLDKRRIHLRSGVQIFNTLSFPVEIVFPSDESLTIGLEKLYDKDIQWKHQVIDVNQKWPLPLNLVANKGINSVKIKPIINNRSDLGHQFIHWKTGDSQKLLIFDDIFVQMVVDTESVPVFISDYEDIRYVYSIMLLPPVTLFNYLPFPLKYSVYNQMSDKGTVKPKKDADMKSILEPGESVKLVNAKIGSSYLDMEIENYSNMTWFASPLIEFNFENAKSRRSSNAVAQSSASNQEINVIEFRTTDTKEVPLGLAYYNVIEKNCLSWTVYAPYWIVNQTSEVLTYQFRGQGDDTFELKDNMPTSPQFLKMSCKIFEVDKKALRLRSKNSNNWSQDLLIDAVGNNGTVVLPSSKGKHQEIGVDIRLSSTGLTKIIYFRPYFMLCNNTEYTIEIHEYANEDRRAFKSTVSLKPNSSVPFWPQFYDIKQKNAMCVNLLAGEPASYVQKSPSNPFWYNYKHTTLLKFAGQNLVNVECIPNEEIVKINFKKYSYGMAPVLVLNCLKNIPVAVKQKDEKEETFVMPQQYFMQTWEKPTGSREVAVRISPAPEKICSLEMMQSVDSYEIAPNRLVYSVMFLDGLQKVIVFIENLDDLNKELLGFKQTNGNEYILNLHSISLSLVDDENAVEVMYLSLFSSDIIWRAQVKGTNLFKQLPSHKINLIEAAYQKYLLSKPSLTPVSSAASFDRISESSRDFSYKTVAIDEEDDVDFERMVMYSGKCEVPIQRHFAPGLFLNYFNSADKTTIHLQVHKLQIDNQLDDCIFPVVFARVPPPKTVANDIMIKPFLELSMVEVHNQRTNLSEIQYFKVLIQEYAVKVDYGFVNAMINFFANSAVKFTHDTNALLKEIAAIRASMTPKDEGQPKEKIYFDLCHISPIKMHLSFSLSNADAFKGNIIMDNPFFKSIGVVLTDMQDVVFKLGYFEIKSTAYAWADLKNETISHYYNQVTRQAYILLLGLDVLGNPFGFIKGISEGVESFFYEPYAGFVQGPGEFAEGVALGVSKLFGSTLGGAAGAFSKITGTLGKGLATLTLDKEYQKARQKKTEAKSSFLQNVGQNLVMGVVDGVTGVYEKPLEGAKQSGFLGFMGGLGKGVIGVVAKPAGGIVDFTTTSLEGIRKVAVQEEIVDRIRPSRILVKNHMIKAYRYKEAKALGILKRLKEPYSSGQFVALLEINAESKTIIIATNRFMLQVNDSLIFGNQNLEWSFEYEEMAKEPYWVDNKLVITIRSEKNFFSSKTTSLKTVPVKDKEEAEKFIQKVRKVMWAKHLI